MIVFDKNTIESFAQKVDDEVIENSLSSLSIILNSAMSDIRKRNPYISENFEIFPVNEFYAGAVLPNSNIDVFLVLNSPQLEFNTVKLIKNKVGTFLSRLKISWNNSKKKKKKDKYIKTFEPNQEQTKNIYNIPTFEKDLVNAIANYITPLSVVSILNGIIQIKGEDLAFNVNIFPVINKYGSYNFYQYNKNKFLNIDYKYRFKHLDEMEEAYGEKFTDLLRIFNALYFNLYEHNANSVLVESLIFNLPEETFNKKTNYEMFVFAINFIANSKVSKFLSISNPEKNMLQDNLISTPVLDILNFVKDIKKYSM
ncbi:MAG: hypothetical protein PHQ62_01425 [Clostridia bacterium]|nr:hypothetical protein [Clostridia bacterium]